MDLLVTEEKRSRLFEAVLEELATEGYEQASLAAAAQRAGIDLDEVKAEFTDKDSCLFAAYEEMCSRVIAVGLRSCDEGATWTERMRSGLAALLEAISGRPQLARAMVWSFPAISPNAYKRYMALISSLVPYVREGRDHAGEVELPADVELLALGSVETIIFAELDAERGGYLGEKMPELLFSLLVPFLGPEQAAEEMRLATTR